MELLSDIVGWTFFGVISFVFLVVLVLCILATLRL